MLLFLALFVVGVAADHQKTSRASGNVFFRFLRVQGREGHGDRRNHALGHQQRVELAEIVLILGDACAGGLRLVLGGGLQCRLLSGESLGLPNHHVAAEPRFADLQERRVAAVGRFDQVDKDDPGFLGRASVEHHHPIEIAVAVGVDDAHLRRARIEPQVVDPIGRGRQNDLSAVRGLSHRDDGLSGRGLAGGLGLLDGARSAGIVGHVPALLSRLAAGSCPGPLGRRGNRS